MKLIGHVVHYTDEEVSRFGSLWKRVLEFDESLEKERLDLGIRAYYEDETNFMDQTGEVVELLNEFDSKIMNVLQQIGVELTEKEFSEFMYYVFNHSGDDRTFDFRALYR